MMENRRRESTANQSAKAHSLPLDDVNDPTRYAAFRHFVREVTSALFVVVLLLLFC
jgi:hypothetical protein